MRSMLVGLVLVFGACFMAGGPAHGGPDKARQPAPAEKAPAEKGSKSDKKAEKSSDKAECQTDRDCVLVTDGCCGCNEGGKQRAVPKGEEDKVEKKRKAGCKQTMCSQMISTHPSCSSRAICQEKVCALGQ